MVNLSEYANVHESNLSALKEQITQFNLYGYSMIKEDCMGAIVPILKNGVDIETKCGSIMFVWGEIKKSVRSYLNKIHPRFNYDDNDIDLIYSIYKFFIVEFNLYLSLAIMSYIKSNLDYINSMYYLSLDANGKMKVDASITDLRYTCNIEDSRLLVALMNVNNIVNGATVEYSVWDYIDPAIKSKLEAGLNTSVWDTNPVSYNNIVGNTIMVNSSTSQSLRESVISNIYGYILKDKKNEILTNSKFFTFNLTY